MNEKDRKIVEAAHVAFQPLIRSVAKDLLAIIDRLDKQLADRNTKLQMVDDLLADAITEAKTQKEYARQLKKQLAALKEAAGPIPDFIRYFPTVPDSYVVAEHFLANGPNAGKLRFGVLRRLVKALDEVK